MLIAGTGQQTTAKGAGRATGIRGALAPLFLLAVGLGACAALWVGLDGVIREAENTETTPAVILRNMAVLVTCLAAALTVVGVLFLRSNRVQSRRLAMANRTLAHKNFELQNEVSQRERLNAVLQKEKQENSAIVNAVSDIIFEITVEGNFLFLNVAWERVTGRTIMESIGKNVFDMMHVDDQDDQRVKLRNMIYGQADVYRSLVRIRTHEGLYRAVELSVSMVRQDEDRNLRVVGTMTDIEERRRVEQALNEAEKQYRAIVEHAAGGIYQLTPAGRYISMNPAMARILGYRSPDEAIGKIYDANSEVYRSSRERKQFLAQLTQEGTVKNFEIMARQKDGAVIWLNENARAVRDDEENILYYEGSIEDVTQRKEAQEQLHEEKVRSDMANRAKSEFLANMSHELRTPLNAIIGFSEIIKNEVFGPVEQRQYWEYASDIYDSGKQLLKIINDILDVSRIEVGDRQLNESIVRLDLVALSALDLLAGKIEAGQLSIVNQLTNDMPKVQGEEIALKQIMVNLLSNAVKFTPENGQITISYGMDDDGQLHLSITDTGIGLNEEEIEKALSPFGQVDSAMNRSTTGTGLGLTLVDALASMHGGAFELLSQKGVGTTATVIIPALRLMRD